MRLNWSEVTAIFGGTFDPPHVGHREAIQGLFENPGIRRVVVLPAGFPPLKSGATASEHRRKMSELGFAGLDRAGEIRIDARELERSRVSGKPSFTIDTLFELKREFPQLAFVVGADQLSQLHVWHRFPELLSASHWIVIARKDVSQPGETAMQTLRQWEASGLIRRDSEQDEWLVSTGEARLKLVQTPARALSSSEIREEIARSSDREKLKTFLKMRLHPAVLAYLMEHRVYGMNGN